MDWRLYAIWISCLAIGISGGATLALFFSSIISK